MFDEAFTKLDLDEVAVIVDVLNKQIRGSIFDPLETTILAIEPDFYPGYRFLNIADHMTNPPLQRFVFQKNDTQDFTIIDWTYQTISHLNASVPIMLDDRNVLDYVRFMFSYVKGYHGKFNICESSDHIQWKDQSSADVHRKLNDILNPLEVKEKSKEGVYVIGAFMMVKDNLYRVLVHVKPDGDVKVTEYDVVMEKMPVLDSIIGQ